jgi:uncharacterized protein YacL
VRGDEVLSLDFSSLGASNLAQVPEVLIRETRGEVGTRVADLLLLRVLFVGILGALAFFLQPFALPVNVSVPVALAGGVIFVLLETRIRLMPLRRLVGAVAGAIVGMIGALLISTVLDRSSVAASSTVPFIQITILAVSIYAGLVVGAAKGDTLNMSVFGGLFGGETSKKERINLLDTSVIIDGRIADIAETGFLDGTLAIPQFVLRELQLVADSADSLKRNRGRRGLDVLQRLQKMPTLNVQIIEEDFPQIRDVDTKLVELGKQLSCKVVTNDFNLNKVAQLHGVEVLNINELANALKPVVLPGEIMRVFVLKEGKEYNQGVAYLDDGTMVVVDNARRLISKTIDIAVTSVLQTTAGKMIFGKFDDRVHAVYEKTQTDRARESSAAAT